MDSQGPHGSQVLIWVMYSSNGEGLIVEVSVNRVQSMCSRGMCSCKVGRVLSGQSWGGAWMKTVVFAETLVIAAVLSEGSHLICRAGEKIKPIVIVIRVKRDRENGREGVFKRQTGENKAACQKRRRDLMMVVVAIEVVIVVV